MKKVFRPVMTLVVAVVALFGGTAVASADTIVPPGGSGSVCSGYAYKDSTHYFQVCAWADANYISFTANFGNASSTPWAIDSVNVGRWWIGVYRDCFTVPVTVPAHSTLGTSKPSCHYPRTRAAVQAFALVSDAGWADSRTSDTLQVQ